MLLSKQLIVRTSGSLSPLKTAILRWLSKDPHTFQDVVAAFGLSPLVIRRCLRELCNEGLLQVQTQSVAKQIRRKYQTKPGVSLELPTLIGNIARDESLSPHWRALNAMGMAPDDV